MGLGGWSLSARALRILLIGALSLSIFTGLSLYHLRSTLLEDRREKVKSLVEAAYGSISYFQQLAAKGTMTEEAAKDAARGVIRASHYDGTEYFFVWDLTGTAVAHGGNPALEGKNLIGFTDPAGNRVIADIVATARDKGEGYTSYLWPKAGQQAPVPKIGYTKLFRPWGWAIGTGVYIDDVDRAFWQQAKTDIEIGVLLLLVFSAAALWFGRDRSRAPAPISRTLERGAGLPPLRSLLGIPRTTPRIIEVGLVLILVLTATIALGSRAAIVQYRQAVGRIGHDVEPAMVSAARLTADLAGMNASIADTVLGDGASWANYGADADRAATVMVSAGRDAHFNAGEMAGLIDLATRLRGYYQMIGEADPAAAGRRDADKALATPLQASRLIGDELIPKAQEIAKLGRSDLDEAYTAYAGGSLLAIVGATVPLFLLLVTLIGLQIILTRRTKRLINIPLAAATLILGGYLIVFSILSVADRRELAVARTDYLADLDTAYDAKVATLQMKADEALWLLEGRQAADQHSLREHYAQGLARQAELLLGDIGEAGDAAASTVVDAAAKRSAALAAYGTGRTASPPAGATGLMGEALRRAVTRPEQRTALADALASLSTFLDADRHMRELVQSGQQDAAVQLAQGNGRNDSDKVFDRLVTLSEAGAGQRLDSAERHAAALAAWLDIVLGLTVIGAGAGLWLRYREFR